VISAGRLRHRVTIQQATEAQNAYGEMTQSWADLATVWGEVRPLMARAREGAATEAEILQARAPYQVRLRYVSGLSPVSHRLVYDDRTFELEAVLDPDGRTHELVCVCVEVQGAGAITAFAAGYGLDFSEATNSMYIAGI
jgi:SPP1 family predicted phage head-tail adaptor